MTNFDVLKGDEVEPPSESPKTVEEKNQSNQGKHLVIGVTLFALLLIGLLIGIVPNWGKKESTLKPFFKAFDPTISVFNQNITKGYADQEELKNDLEQFALLTSNQAINGFYGGGCNDWMYRGGAIAMDMTMSEESSSGKTSSGSTIFFDNVNSFETNNQEEGIDTADQAKSDGRFVYAAYGDTLLVLTLTGERKAQIKLPPIQIPSPEDISTNSKSAPYDYYYYPPKAEITSLLLEGDKLTLLVSGYGAEHTVNAGESPVLCNYLGTRIMMYDTNEGDPHLISQKDIHGGFSQAYSITTDGQQKIGHVVTRASINTWAYLHEPLQRYQFPDEFTDEKYQEEAVKVAKELVPEFVSKLSDALSGIDLSRLSLFTDNIDDEDTLDGIMSQLRVAESISIVSSFVMEDSSSTNLTVSVSGIMQPGNWGYVYSNSQMIVLADKGWGFVEEDGEYVEMTYLLGFRFDGASTTHEIVGSVRGTPLNPYSIDLVEKAAEIHVRIATTMNFWSRSSGILLEDGTSSSTWNEIVVLGTDGSAGNLLVERSSVRLGKPNERFTAVRFLEDIAYAVTFEKRDPFYAIDLSDPDDIKVLGELDISGFSEYLHPIQGDKILAVGQETDDDGQILGLQISLFGAYDPSKLTLLNRLVVENKENQWSGSEVSWEPKAFRYFTVADMGILLIPLNIYDYGRWYNDDLSPENFEGFMVFNVENDTISRRFSIDHLEFANDFNTCSAWCGSLPERSFVIDGKVLTLKSQSIVNTDLGTETAEWYMDVQKDVCCA